MSTVRSADEVRPAEFGPSAKGEIDPDMVAIAETIIDRRSGAFDPTTFRDRYQDALRELVAEKTKGQGVAPREVAEPPKVINLMDALKRSLAQEEKEPAPARKPRPNRPARRPRPTGVRERCCLPVSGGRKKKEEAAAEPAAPAAARRRKAIGAEEGLSPGPSPGRGTVPQRASGRFRVAWRHRLRARRNIRNGPFPAANAREAASAAAIIPAGPQ